MKCPRCTKELAIERHFDIPISRCTACGGILLERGQAEAIDDLDLGPAIEGAAASAATAPTAESDTAHCHECDRQMISLHGPDDIEFDWCDGCERIFFDRGELSAFDMAEGS